MESAMADQRRGSEAIGAAVGNSRPATMLLKRTAEEATWVCPDCGEIVKPIPLGADRYLPKTWCSCPGALMRKERLITVRIAGDEQESEKRQRMAMLRSCGLTAEQCAGMSFESWRQDTPARRKAHLLAKKAVNWIVAGEWGYWNGPFGCGKTHLAYAIARELVLEHGKWARVFNWTEEVGLIQSSWSAQGQDGVESELLRRTGEVYALFLDDVDKTFPSVDGGKPVSHWYISLLYRVINRRYMRRLPTVIIANMPLDQFNEVLARSGGNAAHAVISRVVRTGAVSVDWGKIGLTEWRRPLERPLF